MLRKQNEQQLVEFAFEKICWHELKEHITIRQPVKF